jgi:hypothetical protein
MVVLQYQDIAKHIVNTFHLYPVRLIASVASFLGGCTCSAISFRPAVRMAPAPG